jgi:hypothetical protein
MTEMNKAMKTACIFSSGKNFPWGMNFPVMNIPVTNFPWGQIFWGQIFLGGEFSGGKFSVTDFYTGVPCTARHTHMICQVSDVHFPSYAAKFSFIK